MIERPLRCLARCFDVADLIASVHFVRAIDIRVAIKRM